MPVTALAASLRPSLPVRSRMPHSTAAWDALGSFPIGRASPPDTAAAFGFDCPGFDCAACGDTGCAVDGPAFAFGLAGSIFTVELAAFLVSTAAAFLSCLSALDSQTFSVRLLPLTRKNLPGCFDDSWRRHPAYGPEVRLICPAIAPSAGRRTCLTPLVPPVGAATAAAAAWMSRAFLTSAALTLILVK